MDREELIIKTIRRISDKDSKAYKVTEYYYELTSGTLDEGGIAIAENKIKNIEKDLKMWVKEHPNNNGTVMQPEESALILINYLRDNGFLK